MKNLLRLIAMGACLALALLLGPVGAVSAGDCGVNLPCYQQFSSPPNYSFEIRQLGEGEAIMALSNVGWAAIDAWAGEGMGINAQGFTYGVFARATGDGGTAVLGSATGVGGIGVSGQAGTPIWDYEIAKGVGVFGKGINDGLSGVSNNPNASGCYAYNNGGGWGVYGAAKSNSRPGVQGDNNGAGAGVKGVSAKGEGVRGEGLTGVKGFSTALAGYGVWGEHGGGGYGVVGTAKTTNALIAGVYGANNAAGIGVRGESVSGRGVYGKGRTMGVYGVASAVDTAGVYGQNTGGSGVVGTSTNGVAGNFIITNIASPQPCLKAQTAGTGWAGYFTGTGVASRGVYIETKGGMGLIVRGGTKNAVVSTSKGARALYSEEASGVYFTDYGFGRLENGRVTIAIDPLFAETVNLDQPYHVFLQAYGEAELYVSRRTPGTFEVRLGRGQENVEFSYRLVGKRRGFEQARLEQAAWADQDPNLTPEDGGEKVAAQETGDLSCSWVQ
jgi:hypothetical protein